MGTRTIDQLPAASSLTGTEEVPAWQSGGSVKTTAQDIADLAPAGPTLPLVIGQGGTGQTTAQAALDALFAAVTKGSIWVGDGANVTPLAVDADGRVMTCDSGAPHGVSWQPPAAGGVTTVNGAAGAITVQGTTGQVTVSVAGTISTLSLPTTIDFSASFFRLNGGTGAFLNFNNPGDCTLQSNSGQPATLAGDGGFGAFVAQGDGALHLFPGTGIRIDGPWWSSQTAAATTPGTVVAKLAIFDDTGTLIGYLPIYDTIT